jgi:hypothetical protein
MYNNDFEDRKNYRREKLSNKKKTSKDLDQSYKDIKKIKKEYRSKIEEMEQEELWEEWENEIHRRN